MGDTSILVGIVSFLLIFGAVIDGSNIGETGHAFPNPPALDQPGFGNVTTTPRIQSETTRGFQIVGAAATCLVIATGVAAALGALTFGVGLLIALVAAPAACGVGAAIANGTASNAIHNIPVLSNIADLISWTYSGIIVIWSFATWQTTNVYPAWVAIPLSFVFDVAIMALLVIIVRLIRAGGTSA